MNGQEERENVMKAELIEENSDDVTQVLEILRSALANRCDVTLGTQRFHRLIPFSFSQLGLVTAGESHQGGAAEWKSHRVDHPQLEVKHRQSHAHVEPTGET